MVIVSEKDKQSAACRLLERSISRYFETVLVGGGGGVDRADEMCVLSHSLMPHFRTTVFVTDFNTIYFKKKKKIPRPCEREWSSGSKITSSILVFEPFVTGRSSFDVCFFCKCKWGN